MRIKTRVHPSADVTGHRAPQHADDEAHQRADDADEQRDLRAEQDAGKKVTAVQVRAEPMLQRGGGKLCVGELVGVVELGEVRAGDFQDDRPGDDGQQQKGQEPGADDGGAIRLKRCQAVCRARLVESRGSRVESLTPALSHRMGEGVRQDG